MKTTYIFLHNFRCTGNALNLALSHYFVDDHAKLGRQGESDFSYRDIVDRCQRRQPRFILGHNVFGLHKKFDFPCRYFVNFRDPVARLVSGFAGWSSTSQQSLTDYYRDHEERANGMTYRLLGYGKLGDQYYDYNRDRPLDCLPEITPDLFEQAKDHFSQFVDGVVISEQFTESVVNLEEKWNLPPLVYPQGMSFNQNKTCLAPEHFSPQLIDELKSCNQWDYQLLALAKDRLQNELTERDDNFWHQVRIRKILTAMLRAPGVDLVEGDLLLKKLQAGVNNLYYLGMQAELGEVLRLVVDSISISFAGARDLVTAMSPFIPRHLVSELLAQVSARESKPVIQAG